MEMNCTVLNCGYDLTCPVELLHLQLQGAFQTNLIRSRVHTGSPGTFVPNKADTMLLWKRTAMQLAATVKVSLIVKN